MTAKTPPLTPQIPAPPDPAAAAPAAPAAPPMINMIVAAAPIALTGNPLSASSRGVASSFTGENRGGSGIVDFRVSSGEKLVDGSASDS